MMRFAGQALFSALGGTAAALAADGLAHSEMDRMAQAATDLASAFEAADPIVQQGYELVAGQGAMSNMDRLLVSAILTGAMDERIAKSGPPAASEIKGDTKGGAKAMYSAYQIRARDPQLAQQIGRLTDQELALFAKEGLNGVSSGEVMAAMEAGAGVTPVPAALGGLAGGGAAAAAMAALQRRSAAAREGPRRQTVVTRGKA